MKYKIYQVDTFTNNIFSGNPACVVPLKKWLSDDKLLKIAKENAVAETAYFIDKGREIHLRWFTPDLEIDLCGHATLATAYVLHSILQYPSNEIKFKTLSGELVVTYNEDFYYLNFPSRKASEAELPKEISNSLNIQPQEVFKSRDYMLVYKNEEEISKININRHFFDQINLGYGGVIITAIGDSVDFVSRFFTPQSTILEDPVTGSAHCTLIPYWSSRLSKKKLEALQISERGGRLLCLDNFERVLIGGQAILFSAGEFQF
tara:strand:+ start:1821 stop:2606 length:786 start_codon:yes stop_codon:yes gene_type:complete